MCIANDSTAGLFVWIKVGMGGANRSFKACTNTSMCIANDSIAGLFVWIKVGIVCDCCHVCVAGARGFEHAGRNDDNRDHDGEV